MTLEELQEIIKIDDIIVTIFIDSKAKLAIVVKPSLSESIISRLLFEVGKQLCNENAPVDMDKEVQSRQPRG